MWGYGFCWLVAYLSFLELCSQIFLPFSFDLIQREKQLLSKKFDFNTKQGGPPNGPQGVKRSQFQTGAWQRADWFKSGPIRRSLKRTFCLASQNNVVLPPPSDWFLCKLASFVKKMYCGLAWRKGENSIHFEACFTGRLHLKVYYHCSSPFVACVFTTSAVGKTIQEWIAKVPLFWERIFLNGKMPRTNTASYFFKKNWGPLVICKTKISCDTDILCVHITFLLSIKASGTVQKCEDFAFRSLCSMPTPPQAKRNIVTDNLWTQGIFFLGHLQIKVGFQAKSGPWEILLVVLLARVYLVCMK